MAGEKYGRRSNSHAMNQIARLHNELETLQQIQRHLEREMERTKGQSEVGSPKMLQKALGQVLEKIEKIESKLGKFKGGNHKWESET